jgi:ABC-type dipeptide/oligopeptide/nickel transport system permease subunit
VALAFVLLIIGAAVLAPVLAPTDPFDNDLSRAMQPPGSPGLPLGADSAGAGPHPRVVLYGLRLTLLHGPRAVRWAAGPARGRLRGRVLPARRRRPDAA